MINTVAAAANSVLSLALVAIGLYLANNLRRQLQLKKWIDDLSPIRGSGRYFGPLAPGG